MAPILLRESPLAKAGTPHRVTLGATTTIVGSRPGKIAIHVPRKATIYNPLIRGSDVEVSGKGDFIGVALVGGHHMFLGGRLPGMGESGLFFLSPGTLFARPLRPRWTIPPGDYNLYFFPGDSESSVTLRLRGLSGARIVSSPKRDVDFKAALPDAARPTDNLYAAGAEGDLGGTGTLLGLAWFETQAHAASVVDFCRGDGPKPDSWAYVPYLPLGQDECSQKFDEGSANMTSDIDVTTGPRFLLFTGISKEENEDKKQRTFFQSVTVSTVSVASPVRSFFLWLTH